MNVFERAMNLLSLRYVDDIILNAPVVITEKFIKDYHIIQVIKGESLDRAIEQKMGTYTIAEKLGIFKVVDAEVDNA